LIFDEIEFYCLFACDVQILKRTAQDGPVAGAR
jgi:hypothetical protein